MVQIDNCRFCLPCRICWLSVGLRQERPRLSAKNIFIPRKRSKSSCLAQYKHVLAGPS